MGDQRQVNIQVLNVRLRALVTVSIELEEENGMIIASVPFNWKVI